MVWCDRRSRRHPRSRKRFLSETLGLAFTLLALRGLRASEILGLRVEDMDFDNNQIQVNGTVSRGKVQERELVTGSLRWQRRHPC